ncbi:MAG: dihydroneopterin aldolase [Alphaproteobacteria bacterium]|nr:dihydroneopterin aldolase [Alphaproteobacteria bacterium]
MAAEMALSQRTRTVFIDRLELMGSIGVYEHERRDRQPVVISLDLAVIDTYDGTSEKLVDVYDYDIAIGAIREQVARGHYNLIETLAETIARCVLADRRVMNARVRIEKPAVLSACRSVGIEIERSKK